MKLRKLIKNIQLQQIKGSQDILIMGLCANSKLVAPGQLFIAKKGHTDNGAYYIHEAVAAGASAILTDLYDPSLKQVTQLIHPDVVSIEAALACEYYQHPSDHLFVVGITGTKGKTTISFIVKALLDHFYGPCGLIGTIEYIINQQRYPASRTTPDVITNHRLLRDMVKHECRSVVMEVTSHALDQGRTRHIEFDVAVFSNLQPDHLDYHGTMEAYCHAKSSLFTQLNQATRKKNTKKAVVNIDSPWWPFILKNYQGALLTYGIEQMADLRAVDICLESDKTKCHLIYQDQKIAFQWPFPGRFNVYNCLAAIGVALTQGYSLEEIAEKMTVIPQVKGRLESVPNDLGLKIFVDFAHTGDALANVLAILKEFKQGRLITIFGCGGDRDPQRRIHMAQASEEFSDYTIITTDNPRSEDPLVICQMIAQSFRDKESYEICVDRRQAIARAITLAQPQDTILIAGKGHETSQIFAHRTIEFDDCQIAAELCQASF